jgi:hypothetical protein
VRAGLDGEGCGPGEMTDPWEYPVRRERVKRASRLSEAESTAFGRRVAAWQDLHGLENAELALWLGMSRFRLSRIKHNRLPGGMTADEAVHIAGRLGMRAHGTSVECTARSEQVARQARELFAGQAEIGSM